MSVSVQPQIFQANDFSSAHALANALGMAGQERAAAFSADLDLFTNQSGVGEVLKKCITVARDGLSAGVPLALIRSSFIDSVLFRVPDEEILGLGNLLGLSVMPRASIFALNGEVTAPSLFALKDGALSRGALQFIKGQDQILLGRSFDVLFLDTSISR